MGSRVPKTQFTNDGVPNKVLTREELIDLRSEGLNVKDKLSKSNFSQPDLDIQTAEALLGLQAEMSTALQTIAQSTDERIKQRETFHFSQEEELSTTLCFSRLLTNRRTAEHGKLHEVVTVADTSIKTLESSILSSADKKIRSSHTSLKQSHTSLAISQASLSDAKTARKLHLGESFGDVEIGIQSLNATLSKATSLRIRSELDFEHQLQDMVRQITSKLAESTKLRILEISNMRTASETQTEKCIRDLEDIQRELLHRLVVANDGIVDELNRRVGNVNLLVKSTEFFLDQMGEKMDEECVRVQAWTGNR